MSDAQDKQPAKPKRTRKAPAGADGADAEAADTPKEDAHEPQPCMPCHGTGKVISNLGGTPRKITCPWCRGGGIRLTGVDAQEFQQEQSAALKRR